MAAQAAAVTERTSPSSLSGGTSSTTRSIIFTTSPAPGDLLARPCVLAAVTECHGGRPAPVRMLRRGLAEGEAVGLGAWIEEGDLAGAVSDGAGLADELVNPLLHEGAVAGDVDVRPVALAWWLTVEQDAKLHRSWCRRS